MPGRNANQAPSSRSAPHRAWPEWDTARLLRSPPNIESGVQSLETDRNDRVETMASLRVRADQAAGWHQRRMERITAQLGQPRSFYLIAAFAAAWGALNVFAPRLSLRPFDPPPFEWLQGIVGLGALLMTVIILITQNRRSSHAEQRAQLDLQVNLLAEQKVAKLIALLEELRHDLPIVRDRVDAIADAMKEPVDARAILDALQDTTDPSADVETRST
jgi:uncharacterized membrane protein